MDLSKWEREKYAPKLPMLSSGLIYKFNKKPSMMKDPPIDSELGKVLALQK